MGFKEHIISQNTRVVLNISQLFLLIGAIVTGAFVFSEWKTEYEMIQQQEIVRLDKEIEERKLADMELIEEQKEIKILIIDNNTQQAQILTEIEWLKATQLQILEKLK